MLDKFFVILDDYRRSITAHVEKNTIEEKQWELNVKFPLAMVEFYTHFGNDKEVLSSFYVFDTVENIRIEYDAEWINRDDVMDRLEYINIYPNEYTNVPFSSGCYRDAQGNWYYYTQIDERTSLTPNGKMATEDECFNHLKTALLVEIQHHEAKNRAEAERIRVANLTLEQKAEREREAKLLRIFHLVMNMFSAENNKAKRLHQVKIDLNKIYKYMNKLSSLIQSGSYMQVDLLILQKISLVFGDMNAKEDKKIIATK